MKKLLFLVVLATMILTGCFYAEPVRIGIVRDPAALRSPDPKVWRPDPTRIIFQNHSDRIYVKIWVGENPNDMSSSLELGPEEGRAPDVELAPEEGQAFNFSDTGTYIIHIAGREVTNSGWKDLGTKNRSVDIRLSGPSGNLREISISDWDFTEHQPRKYNHNNYRSSPNRWRRY